jgi:hypothetical protein
MAHDITGVNQDDECATDWKDSENFFHISAQSDHRCGSDASWPLRSSLEVEDTGVGRDRGWPMPTYREERHSQAARGDRNRSYVLLDLLDARSRSSNFDQYPQGQDAARGPHLHGRSNALWLPEIACCITSMACILGERADSLFWGLSFFQDYFDGRGS